MKRTAGFTLVEMLLGLVIFTVVMAGALSFLTAQSRGFRRGDQDMSTLLNLSYGADHLHAHLRTAGANVAFRQPLLVYAGPSAFSFNADYASNDAGDISAVYVDPDVPPEETDALTLAGQITIPASNPALVYPAQDYAAGPGINSAAETISSSFKPTSKRPGVTISSCCGRSTASHPSRWCGTLSAIRSTCRSSATSSCGSRLRASLARARP